MTVLVIAVEADNTDEDDVDAAYAAVAAALQSALDANLQGILAEIQAKIGTTQPLPSAAEISTPASTVDIGKLRTITKDTIKQGVIAEAAPQLIAGALTGVFLPFFLGQVVDPDDFVGFAIGGPFFLPDFLSAGGDDIRSRWSFGRMTRAITASRGSRQFDVTDFVTMASTFTGARTRGRLRAVGRPWHHPRIRPRRRRGVAARLDEPPNRHVSHGPRRMRLGRRQPAARLRARGQQPDLAREVDHRWPGQLADRVEEPRKRDLPVGPRGGDLRGKRHEPARVRAPCRQPRVARAFR